MAVIDYQGARDRAKARKMVLIFGFIVAAGWIALRYVPAPYRHEVAMDVARLGAPLGTLFAWFRRRKAPR